jgi:hypothetical protein
VVVVVAILLAVLVLAVAIDARIERKPPPASATTKIIVDLTKRR